MPDLAMPRRECRVCGYHVYPGTVDPYWCAGCGRDRIRLETRLVETTADVLAADARRIAREATRVARLAEEVAEDMDE